MGSKKAKAPPPATPPEEAEKLPLQSSNTVNVDSTVKTTKQIQREHILHQPDTYIGSIKKHKRSLWVYNALENRMVYKELNYVPGLFRIFDEILINAADNKQIHPNMKKTIKVNIDVERGRISVYNDGRGIPVEIHKEAGVYVPEFMFGHLLTNSSNFDDDDDDDVTKANYGPKLTNIFSKEFVIQTADGKRKYNQVFYDNMGRKSKALVSRKWGQNWTKVIFKPDLAKFGMEKLDDDMVDLMKKRVVDLAGCLGKSVDVFLNGYLIPIKTFAEYCSLYLPGDIKSVYVDVNERWQVCVSQSKGEFQQVSFVNGIATVEGGTHVDYITNQIVNHLVRICTRYIVVRGGCHKRYEPHLKRGLVKNQLWVFVNALVDNITFDSHTKETFTLPQSKFETTCDLSKEFLKKIETETSLVDVLLPEVNFKRKKFNTEKVYDNKLEDANHAGKSRAHECTLILAHRNSAKALAMAGISVVGRDRYGVFTLTEGMILNYTECKKKGEKNEVTMLERILGLEQGRQYDSVEPLRYDRVMLMANQDHDGSHFKGLLINFFHTYWPSLLKLPSFLVDLITPIVKATHIDGKLLSFYTMSEYESWKESLGSNANGWSVKYYKGLGTNTSKEMMEYFEDIESHVKKFKWVDEQDGDSIELAFSNTKSEARNNWLNQSKPPSYLDRTGKYIRYRDFVNKELILFLMADRQRLLPSVVDGLTLGQRKIVFCAFKRNFVQEATVAQFSAYVSQHSAYDYDLENVPRTIIGMAQNFVGSNNIHFFEPKGQFGSRYWGGKDFANDLYTYTNLHPITRYLFPKDDDALLDYKDESGQSIEPIWYIPIIPMVLVNGVKRCGTGWSSYIPNYNPKHIIENIRRLMNDEPLNRLHPWYRGFNGTIEERATEETYSSYALRGKIEEVNETTVRITELPPGLSTSIYKKFLESMLEVNTNNEEAFIEDLFDYSDHEFGDFLVILSEEKMKLARQEGLLEKFKLQRIISTCNMHLFDSQGVIKQYDTPEQIIEEFFNLRLEFYEKRKFSLVNNLEMELLKLENKARFVLEVVQHSFIVIDRERADMFDELKVKGYTPFPNKKSVEAVLAGSVDHIEDAEEDHGEIISSGVQASDYDYLLLMPIGTFTIEKIQQLFDEQDKMKEEVAEMRRVTARALWMKDLDALEEKLGGFKRREEEV